jgi:serine phosphatase RsbU (regulator of sigma subunit)
MSLLIFCYILAAFLFFFSYWLDSRAEKIDASITSIAMASALVSLFAGVSASLAYAGQYTVCVLCLKVCLILVAFVTLSLLKYAIIMPYQPKSPALSVVVGVFTLAAAVVLFPTITGIHQTAFGLLALDTLPFYGLMDGPTLFVAVFVIGIPALAVFIMLMRAIGIRSRIYRQRLLLVAVSVIAGFAVSYLLYRLSLGYMWAMPLIPFGLAVMLLLIYQSVSVTTLFDRTLIVASVVNFSLISFVMSVAVGFLTTMAYRILTEYVLIFAALLVIVVGFLALRHVLSHWIRRYIRVGSDYAAELEAGLDAIDFTSSVESVIKSTSDLLTKCVEAGTIEIVVSDDKSKLKTVYSTTEAKHEIAIDNKAIDFLLGHSDSIVLKTQAITNHVYADIKPELLKIFEVAHADAFILIREGHRVVGILLLGPKRHGADYTDYDYRVLSKLYSNFFLVMYYLKNIANEAVVLTVDREIEFSGQVISSIQENIDRINHEKIDVDFITRSARKLGGDFIDFIKLGPDKYLFVMGDVSGKGLNASMSMVILKSVLRTFLTETSDFKKLVVKVNLFIKNNLPKGTFFAGVFGLIDFSSNTMYYINCGVPAMFLYTAAYNNAIEIQGDGRVLGFVRDITKFLKVKKIVLNPQDIILLTTDGLVDSTNLRGERFGKDRVQRLLLDNRSYPAGRMAKFLCDNLTDFVSRELEDDITVLVFKYLSK